MSNNSNADTTSMILNNLKELDDVSQKVSNDIEQKNKILQGGLKSWRSNKLYTDKINSRNKNARKNN